MKHFQFHRLNHILALSEPQDQFVAFFHAASSQPYPMIKISQLIRPFFSIVSLLQLLQYTDALLQVYVLCFIKPVLQNIPFRVLRRHAGKFIIVIHRLHKFLRLDAQFAERVTDRPPARFLLVCQQQHVLCILIPPVHFVQIADRTEHHHAFHPAPVNGIRNFRRFSVCPFRYQRFYLFRPYFIFIFIQGNPLPLPVKTIGKSVSYTNPNITSKCNIPPCICQKKKQKKHLP